MRLLPDIAYLQTRETLEAGMSACTNCPHNKEADKAIVILHQYQELPKCPECGQPTYWMKF